MSSLSKVTSITDTAPAAGLTLTGKNLPTLVGANRGAFIVLLLVKFGSAGLDVTESSTVCCHVFCLFRTCRRNQEP